MLHAGNELHRVRGTPLAVLIGVIGRVFGHIDVNPPNLVYQVFEVLEVQDHVVVDGDVEVALILDGVLDQARPAARVPIIGELAHLPDDVDAVADIAPRSVRYLHHQVAGDGEHPGGLAEGIDGEDEHGVGAGRRVLGDAHLAIQPQKEDVDPLLDIRHLGIFAAVHAGEIDAELDLVAGEEDIVRHGYHHQQDIEGDDGEQRDAEDQEGVEPAASGHGGRLRAGPGRPLKGRALPVHCAATPLLLGGLDLSGQPAPAVSRCSQALPGPAVLSRSPRPPGGPPAGTGAAPEPISHRGSRS